jgi:hypothetical protein
LAWPTLVGAISALILAACGPARLEDDGSNLFREDEITSLRQQIVPPETAPDQSATGKSFYVRVAWSDLSGKGAGLVIPDWAGSFTADDGTVQLTHILFQDGSDQPEASGDSSQIRWSSRGNAQLGGLVARVEVPADDATLSLEMPLFHRTFRASELTGGDDAIFPIDAEGHVVTVSSIPASSCKGGFVLGAVKSGQGWFGFAGRASDRTGRFMGTIRFRTYEDGSIKGRLLDDSGRVIARLGGTLVQDREKGGSYSAELVTQDDKPIGSITGIYTGPTSSQRGSFQGTYEQVCE